MTTSQQLPSFGSSGKIMQPGKKKKSILCQVFQTEGFTIIELMVAITLFLFLSVALISYFIQHQKTYTSQELITEMQDYVRSAMDFMAREIRHAGYKASPGITPSNSDSSQLEINFWDDDDGEVKTVQYYVSNNKLIRKIGNNPDSLAENITSVSFGYSPALPDTTLVEVTINGRTAQVDPLTGSYKTFSLKSDVSLRNR